MSKKEAKPEKKAKGEKKLPKVEVPTYATIEEANAAFTATRNELKEARDKLVKWRTKNKLKLMQDYSDDPKYGAEFKKFSAEIDKLMAFRNGIEEQIKALKPPKEKRTKYEYPEGMTNAEKKKFRAQQRSAAKKKDKGDSPKKDKAPAKKEEPVKASSKDKGKKVEEKSSGKPEKKAVKKSSKSDD